MEAPRISILLPTYEPNPAHLRTALDVAMTQTEKSWTLHINDDASATDTRAIVGPYLKDQRITFARNAKRLGIGGNWNACLNHALSPRERDRVRGVPPYIQFLFQDDLWSFDYLAHAMRAMEEHPTVGLVSMEHDYDCEQGIPSAPLYNNLRRFRKEHIATGIHCGKELLRWWLELGLRPNIVGEPSFVLLRRSAVEGVGLFDRRMRQNLDVEYWTRMLERHDWCYCAENGGTFRVHEAGASERNRRSGRGLYDRLRTIERLLRRSGNGRRERASVLAHHAAEMIRQRRATAEKNRPRVPHLLPLLSFVLRHPVVTFRALARATAFFSYIHKHQPSSPLPRASSSSPSAARDDR